MYLPMIPDYTHAYLEERSMTIESLRRMHPSLLAESIQRLLEVIPKTFLYKFRCTAIVDCSRIGKDEQT